MPRKSESRRGPPPRYSETYTMPLGAGGHQNRSRSAPSRPDEDDDRKNIFQRPPPKEPPLDDRVGWIKFHKRVEGELRKWLGLEASGKQAAKTLEMWDRILPYIENLVKAASMLFQLDNKYYLKEEMDSRVWKYGIYHFISIFRSNDSTSRSKYNRTVIDMGIWHFEKLLKVDLPKVSDIKLESILSHSGLFRISCASGKSSSVEDLIYRLFIKIGDLYRYRYLADKKSSSLKAAKSMYTNAAICDPDNPRAFYQLGLVSKSKGDIIGTIYNFTRSWHVKKPVDGANQQLGLIYDDVSRKYNEEKIKFWYSRVLLADKIYGRSRLPRVDVWIPNSDYYSRLPNPVLPPTRRDHLNSLSSEAVFSRFSLAYGHFLGMLYTNIGTENLEIVMKDAIVYLEGLVMIKDFNDLNILMQVVGMILFTLDNLEPPEPTENNAPLIAQRKYLTEIAFNFAAVMFMIFAEKLVGLIQKRHWDHPMFIPCTAALHVWCNWSTRHNISKQLRNYKKWKANAEDNKDQDLRYRGPSYIACILRVHTELKTLSGSDCGLVFPQELPESSLTATERFKTLPEKIALDGFAKVVLPDEIDTTKLFFNENFPQEMAQTRYRFQRILHFTRDVFGNDGWETVTKRLRRSSGSRTNSLHDSEPLDSIYKGDFQVVNNLILREKLQKTHDQRKRSPDCNNARVIIKLGVSQKNEAGEENKDPEAERPQSLQSLEETTMSQNSELRSQLVLMGVRTEMIITPIKVVLDTNTFIRSLKWIEVLVHTLPYRLIVPTTVKVAPFITVLVLLELRGLAKGAVSGESPRGSQKSQSRQEAQLRMEDIMKVGQLCVSALDFLDKYKEFFEVVTIKGKKVQMHRYKTQKIFDVRFDQSVRNDEKILKTCCQIEEHDQKARAKDTPLRVYRNTVLLTGDRSLRVRAFAQEIPARDIQSFTTWIIDAKKAKAGSLMEVIPMEPEDYEVKYQVTWRMV